jgi:hypothetical protein
MRLERFDISIIAGIRIKSEAVIIRELLLLPFAVEVTISLVCIFAGKVYIPA